MRSKIPALALHAPRLTQHVLQHIPLLFFSAVAICSASESRPLMREFIGVNGHTVQFKPDLYPPVCRLVRDYHPVSWDLGTNTSELPAFPFAKNRVDWSKVYGSWRDKGFTIDVSLMFESIEKPRWHDFSADAKAYGRSFAHEFGPSGKRKYVESIEIGNEPGRWSDADYAAIFRAMAEGIRAGDPAMKIATCNLTTGKSGSYEKSVECVSKSLEFVDVLNIHTYAQLENWPTWRRSFPEDPRLPKYLNDVEALCRWRDEHAPGKPVWITEFGYDSTTQPQEKSGDFARWTGVTDEQQAQWLVRSLLVFSAMPVQRAYIYFFNDDDKARLHGSSGLTRHFQPKPAFHAVAHLQRCLGEYRFHSIVTNTPALRVYEFEHGVTPAKRAWAAWVPTHDGAATTVRLQNVPGALVRSENMPFTTNASFSATASQHGNEAEVRISGSPVYLFFEAQ